jgi:hypothetical protein
LISLSIDSVTRTDAGAFKTTGAHFYWVRELEWSSVRRTVTNIISGGGGSSRRKTYGEGRRRKINRKLRIKRQPIQVED